MQKENLVCSFICILIPETLMHASRYYICVNVNPPQVTMTHPLGPRHPKAPTDLVSAPHYADYMQEPMLSEQENSTFSPSPHYTDNMHEPMPTEQENPTPSSPHYTDNTHEPMLAMQENSTFLPSPQPPTTHRPSVIKPRKSGLTFAQKLYASSVQDPGSPTSPTTTTGILTPPASPPGSASTFTSNQGQPTRIDHRHSNTLGPGTYHYLDTSGLHSHSLNA